MSEILIIIGLILLNGVFSMSEVAMISARKSRLSTDAKKGSKAAQKALDLSGNPDRFLSTVQIGITLIGILTGIYSGNKIATDLTDFMLSCGVSSAYAAVLAQGTIVVVVTYLTIIFGELVPKRIRSECGGSRGQVDGTTYECVGDDSLSFRLVAFQEYGTHL